MSEDDSNLGLKVHEDAYRELERERDEWKAKFIKQNKDLGCEMMDPAGTIWDYASSLQRENVQLKREVAGWMAAAKQWRENAIKLTDQRDRLVDALELLLDGLLTYAPDYMHGLPKRHYFDEAMEALAAWKGGSDE